jgi:hypothetical protein
MNTFRILGLDDDNHSYCWVCEDGTRCETTKEIMEFLAQPHESQVEIKMFAIIDDTEGPLSNYDVDEVDDMFYMLEGVSAETDNFAEVFDLFWKSANRMHW